MESQEGQLSYEDIRQQRLEENKKRMQELGLSDLSKNLSSDFTASKTTVQVRQTKPRIPREFLELRRSSRVAANPAPDYREVDADSSLGRRSYSSRASLLLNRKYASDEARLDAILQAETIMKELPRSNPSFVKPMLQSHTTGGFWLGLPSNFCKTYLPKKDDRVVLENEKGDEWDTVYLSNKTGLSGGWRGFSLDHGLVDGDSLVFELIEHCRFKIHIVRASEEAKEDNDTKDALDAELDEKPKGYETQMSKKSKSKKSSVSKETAFLKSKSAKKQQLKGLKGAESEIEDCRQRFEKQLQRKKDGNMSKRRLEEDDDIKKVLENEDNTGSTGKPITSYMRIGKPVYGREAKKPTNCDVITVC